MTRLAPGAAVLLGLAARLLLPTFALLACILALLAAAASIAALIALGRDDARNSRILCPMLFGLTLIWAWEMLVE